MSSITRCLTLLVLLVTSAVASAHPGHGLTEPQTLTHQLVEPVHAVPWLLLIGIGVTLSAMGTLVWRQHQQRRAAATVGDRRRSTAGRS